MVQTIPAFNKQYFSVGHPITVKVGGCKCFGLVLEVLNDRLLFVRVAQTSGNANESNYQPVVDTVKVDDVALYEINKLT